MLNIILGIIGVMMLVVPAEASTGSTALRCRWCGASCGNYPVNTRCEDVLPADGGLCVEENGVCVVKQGDVEVTPSAYVTCKRCATGVSHGSGNANCDTEVGLMDFGIWKSEYQSGVGRDADFNCDGEVGLMDFGLWKAGYQSGLTVTPTTIMSVTTPTIGVTPTGIMSVTTPTAIPTDEVCRADGAQCRGNSDCCSGDCNNGQCGESVSTQCNPPQTDPHYVELNGSCQEVNSCGFNSQACL